MNTDLFIEMLQIDSTSGRERKLADFLADRLLTSKCRLERFDVESMKGDAPEGCGCPQNLLFLWGDNKDKALMHVGLVLNIDILHIKNSLMTASRLLQCSRALQGRINILR